MSSLVNFDKMWREAIMQKAIDPNELKFGSGYHRNIVNAVTVLSHSIIYGVHQEALREDAQKSGVE